MKLLMNEDNNIIKYQKITKVSKTLHENNSQKATNENDKEIPIER